MYKQKQTAELLYHDTQNAPCLLTKDSFFLSFCSEQEVLIQDVPDYVAK